MNELFNISYFGTYERFPETKAKHRIPLNETRMLKKYHLEYYLEDSGISYVNGKAYENRKGNVLLVKPGDTRSSEGKYKCFCIHFECSSFRFEEEYIFPLPACVYAPTTEKLFAAAVSGFSVQDLSNSANVLSMNASLMSIFSELHRLLNGGTIQRHHIEKDYTDEIAKVTEFIKNHFAEEIHIERLYKNVFMSKTSFFKYFKKFTGKTPSEYINGVRIENARKLFLRDDYTLSQISHMSGFSSQNYFNHIFKKMMGLSPTEYKAWLKTQIPSAAVDKEGTPH